MAPRFQFLVLLLALVVPLALAGQPASVLAAGDTPPTQALKAQPLDAIDTYIITLDNPALATFRGGIRDLAPTSTELTGARRVDVNSTASQAYLAFLAEKRTEFLQRVEEKLGRVPEVGYIYDVVLNGLTLQLTASEAEVVKTRARR